jgi:3-mercaptopyruvate sulfurtransferase SseA
MTIITYCDGERCPLSRELAEALRVEGVENVRELRNGWTLWQEQGLPTATEHGGGQS